MQRWQCPIHKSTLKNVIWPLMWNILYFSTLNWLILIISKFFIENNQFSRLKHWYIIHTWSDKALKGTVVNQTLPSSHGRACEITHTVPLALLFKTNCPKVTWFQRVDCECWRRENRFAITTNFASIRSSCVCKSVIC